MTLVPAFDAAGQCTHLVGVVHDVTEKKAIESMLLQSQKMESIGHLAGGIAHDFNNVLSVILGNCELLIEDLKPGDTVRRGLETIRKAGQRAAALTHQLLAFSRHQVLELKTVSLNDTIVNMDGMLRRLIGENISLVTRPAHGLDLVKIDPDPGQMEQVLMNLAVSARDAMAEGGSLIIETADVELDERYAREHLGAAPGPHVMMAVSDTGVGMDKETIAQIFEPFFTTKEEGKGTGLGLSTVFGIVQQSGGNVWVYSEPGKGTTFKIYLPRTVDGEMADVAEPPPQPGASATETILVVEGRGAGAGAGLRSTAQGGRPGSGSGEWWRCSRSIGARRACPPAPNRRGDAAYERPGGRGAARVGAPGDEGPVHVRVHGQLHRP